MQNFSDYLETKRIVTKKRVPYYVAWASQFFNYFDKKPNDEISSEEIDKFLSQKKTVFRNNKCHFPVMLSPFHKMGSG